MRKHRQGFYYGLLGLCWLGLVAWQITEHRRVQHSLRQAQMNRAADIANSLAVVIRSQRRFGVVPRPRLVAALQDLASSHELLGIALLNPAGEVIASGGQTIPGTLANLVPGSAVHNQDRLIAAFLVELGPEPMPHDRPGTATDGQKTTSAILWTPEEPPAPRDGAAGAAPGAAPGPAPNAAPVPPPGGNAPGPAPTAPAGQEAAAAPPASPPPPPPPSDEERALRRARWERMRSTHPFFQSDEKYRELYESQGLHMMAFMLDHRPQSTVVRQDLFVRSALAGVAFLAFLFFGLAWRGINRSTQLQIRLVRARAVNNYLRELNLAAAGLAHETRNPLNIVRGIAQTICGSGTTPPPTRDKLQTVMEEVDRVTARLNEFIEYSKPREPELGPVSPTAVVRDVARTLEPDFEDKHIVFACPESDLQVMADPTMLRQVLFNLLLNAVQAVPSNGHIEVQLRATDSTCALSVCDDGVGVPPEARTEIFRPYFTLRDKGTGLGLAIVRQIALAHGWEISYEPRQPAGSILCLSGLQIAGRQQP